MRKRILSLVLALIMLVGYIPMEALAEMPDPIVTEVDVRTVYETGFETAKNSITIYGSYLADGDSPRGRFFVQPSGSTDTIELKPQIVTSGFLTFDNLTTRQMSGELIMNLGPKPKVVDISKVSFPKLDSIDPGNGTLDIEVEENNKVKLHGSEFKAIKDGEVKGQFMDGSNRIEISPGEVDLGGGNEKRDLITKKFTTAGLYSIRFYKERTKDGVKTTVSNIYSNRVRAVGRLDVSDLIKMTPNIGKLGTEVDLSASKLLNLDNMSVFMVKDLGEEITEKHKAEGIRYIEGKPGEEDKYTFKVPESLKNVYDTHIGQYYIILTNKVNKGDKLPDSITRRKVLREQFLVVDSDNAMTIKSIDPKEGPNTPGYEIDLTGRYIGDMSDQIHKHGKNMEREIIKGDYSLTVRYKGGRFYPTGPIAPETPEGEEGKPEDKFIEYDSFERKITGVIGGKVSFDENNVTISQSGVDALKLILPGTTDTEDLIKDVVLEVESTLKYKDEKGNPQVYKFKERDIYRSFEYKPVAVPDIKAIVPSVIPVDSEGNVTPDNIQIVITGENFLVHRYHDGEKYHTKYPVIDLGALNRPGTGEITIDKNNMEDLEFEIYNDDGEIVDGSRDNKLGSKIIFTLPKNSKIDKEKINHLLDVMVANPAENNEKVVVSSNQLKGLAMYSKLSNGVLFQKVDIDDIPNIIKLDPSVVPVEGHKGAIITGGNFRDGLKIYLEGEELKNIEINPGGNRITLDLPGKPEGVYPIIIQNRTGGIDIVNVEYIRYYTTINLKDFNPKRGTANTIVTIRGDGFKRPNDEKITNLDSKAVAKRLIGTTVYLGGEDVNKYNTDSEGKIILQSYNPKENILDSTSRGDLKVADFARSLILEREKAGNTSDYFSIYNDYKTGEYLLSDTVDQYRLGVEFIDGRYKVTANLRGKPYAVRQVGNNLILEDGDGNKVEFKIKTPYEVNESGIITGHNVMVINENEIIFKVPFKARGGYYDLTVENPDTRSDSKLGEDGFFYVYQPGYNPEILKIVPNEGSAEGGYYIDIYAKAGYGFQDLGTAGKTEVIIGALKVPAEDVIVSSDGLKLSVKVPAYPGDLSSEIDKDRRSVVVTVVNPDGGSDSVENGFTYVLPLSQPTLTNLFKKEGPAVGGDIVIIEGTQFRYFEPYDDANKNADYDEGEEFRDLNNNGKFDDLRNRQVWVGEFDQETGRYDRNLKKKHIDSLTEEEWDLFVRPIIPRVYFGSKEVEVVGFSDGMVEVVVPRGDTGDVMVYLVNNDYGKSNELKYVYKETNPKIVTVTPEEGPRSGQQTVQILGEDFVASDIYIARDSEKTRMARMPLIQFGGFEDENMSNKKFKLGETDSHGFENSGRIERKRAEVHTGDLVVVYDSNDPNDTSLKLSIRKGIGQEEKTYEFNYKNWDEKEMFVPISLLRDRDENPEGEHEPVDGFELIRITTEIIPDAQSARRLRVDRGFAPDAKLITGKHIELKTPSYYRTNDTNLTVINPDGKTASHKFGYRNPSTSPVITNIMRNNVGPQDEGDLKILRVPQQGGSRIRIDGRDFRKGARVIIGGDFEIPKESLEYYPKNSNTPEYIMFTMPKVKENMTNKNYQLTVINPDSGTYTTDEMRIRFVKPETVNMEVTGIVPNKGPTKGGTEATIYGKDFRGIMEDYPGERLRVYFERGNKIVEVPKSDILHVDYDSISILTPAFTSGFVNIIVENPDGNSVRLLDGFEYTSDPIIQNVVDPEDENISIGTISFEGGEKIKLKGTDFLEGARVIFNPKLREMEDKEDDASITEGEIVVINGKRYNLSFKSSQEVPITEYINGQNIIVTTPAGEFGDRGILLINPDGGVSNVYNIEFGIPEIGAPFNVRAEILFDQYIRVSWNGVRNASEYEIYVSENRGPFKFVDSTNDTNFMYLDVKPETRYQFLVKAIGKYGESKTLEESKSNFVTTGLLQGQQDLDGPLGKGTTVKRQGNEAQIILGREDYKGDGMIVDLTRGKLAGCDSVKFMIPSNIAVRVYQKDITVIGKDFTMQFNPKIFTNQLMAKNENRADAGIEFKLGKYKGMTGASTRRVLLSPRYRLEASNYVGKQKSAIGVIANPLKLAIDKNSVMATSGAIKDIKLSSFNLREGKWKDANYINKMEIYAITGTRR